MAWSAPSSSATASSSSFTPPPSIPVTPVPEKKPKWNQRSFPKNSENVVQALLHREMGMPFFSRSGDSMSNGMVDKHIGRHLVKGRAEGPEDKAQRPLDVALVGNQEKNEHTRHDSKTEPPIWFTMVMNKITQLYYSGGLFWKTEQVTTIDLQSYEMPTRKVYYSSFLKLYPGRSVTFKEYKSIEGGDKIVGFEEISCRLESCPKEQSPTCLILLTKKGLLTAINIGSLERIKQKDSMQLPGYSTPPHTNRFTELSVNNETGAIYALSAQNGQAKSLYIISFPPWRVEKIISITIPIKLQLCGSSVVIQGTSHVKLTSIETLISMSEENVCDIQPDPGDYNDGKNDTEHRTLDRKPEPIAHIKTLHGYFGALESTWPPLYFSKSKKGLQICRFDLPNPIWLSEIGPYDQFWFQPLPDGSNSAFVTKDTEQFVITWKPERPDSISYETPETNPFLISTPNKAEKDASPNGLRHRACKSRKNYSEVSRSSRVLGIGYSSVLELLAVCTAVDETLVVTLYEPITFKVFKRYPPVTAFSTKMLRSRRRQSLPTSEEEDEQGQNISVVDEIRSINIEIDYEIIYIAIRYKDESMIFCLRILQDNCLALPEKEEAGNAKC